MCSPKVGTSTARQGRDNLSHGNALQSCIAVSRISCLDQATATCSAGFQGKGRQFCASDGDTASLTAAMSSMQLLCSKADRGTHHRHGHDCDPEPAPDCRHWAAIVVCYAKGTCMQSSLLRAGESQQDAAWTSLGGLYFAPSNDRNRMTVTGSPRKPLEGSDWAQECGNWHVALGTVRWLTCNAGEDTDDGEGDGRVSEQVEVPPQLLLVSCQRIDTSARFVIKLHMTLLCARHMLMEKYCRRGSPSALRRASPESMTFPVPFSILQLLQQPCACQCCCQSRLSIACYVSIMQPGAKLMVLCRSWSRGECA